MGVRGAFAIAMGALVGGAGACIVGGTFACTEDAECSGDGVCEPTGWCSFPDESCESHSRYSPWAGDGLAHECTTPGSAGSTTGFGTESTSDEAGPSGPPAIRDSEGPECGNGIVEVGEACDEEDDVDGDGCNTNCVLSGSYKWRRIKESLGDDEGYDVATTANAEHYVVGTFASQQGNGWVLKFHDEGDEDWTQPYGLGQPDSAYGLAVLENVPDDCAPGDVSVTALFVGGFSTPYDDPDDDEPDEKANLIAKRYDDVVGNGVQCWTSSYGSQQTPQGNIRRGDDRLFDVAAAPGVPFVVMFGHLREEMNGFDVNATARAYPLGSNNDVWFWTTGLGADDDYARGGVVDELGRTWMVGYRIEDGGDVDAWIAHLAVSDADPPVPSREWTAIVADPASDDVFEDVALTATGDLVAVGSKGTRGWVTAWHAETVANGTDGTPFAERELATPGDATIYGVAIDGAGAIVVVGEVQTPANGKDAWVEKLDAALETSIWSHQIDGTAHGDDVARGVAIAPGDVVIVAGDLLQTKDADLEDGVDRDVWLEAYEP